MAHKCVVVEKDTSEAINSNPWVCLSFSLLIRESTSESTSLNGADCKEYKEAKRRITRHKTGEMGLERYHIILFVGTHTQKQHKEFRINTTFRVYINIYKTDAQLRSFYNFVLLRFYEIECC